MKRFLKWFFLLGLLAFVVIQFIRIDKSVPDYDTAGDFLLVNNTDTETALLIKSACYDCHSFETKYPWYSQVAPISWWIGDHIEEGREHLNFSTWNMYDLEKQDHKLEECVEEMEEGKMPDPNYVKMHPDSDLNESQKKQVIDYFQSLRVFAADEHD